MSAIDQEPFPRGALLAAGFLVGASLLITAGARLSQVLHPVAASRTAGPPPAQKVDLSFFDQRDGSVLVRDSRDGRRVSVLAPGTNGFVRGVVRGLAHDRKRRGIGSAPPFSLMRWSDGRLALEDTATGRTIDLDAFGISNKQAFSDLLPRGARS